MQYDTTKPFSKKNLKPLCEMLVQRLVYHKLGVDFGDCSIRYFGLNQSYSQNDGFGPLS